MRIITPVGLSLTSNYFDPDKGNGSEGKRDFNALKHKRASQYEKEKPRIGVLKKGMERFVKSDNASAEISSIRKIVEKFPENEFYVSLLPSDTILSQLTAELIRDSKILESHQVKEVTVEPFIQGLQVHNEQEFIQNGLKNLIRKISDFKNQEQGDLVINITGGYKATIPYLTLMGQIYNIPLYYTFEETTVASQQLIRIPQTPIDINYGLFEKYAHIFLELDAGVYDWENFRKKYYYYSETDELAVHSCVEIFQIDGKEVAELSPIGKMFWNRYNDFYPVKVLAGSNYFAEKDKTNINRAIRELCQRLDNLFSGKKVNECEEHFLGLHDPDLKHVRIGKNNLSQVYKHSNPQIRLHYVMEFSDTGYAVKVLNFRHRKDNSDYATEFNNDYQSISEHRYTTIAILKK